MPSRLLQYLNRSGPSFNGYPRPAATAPAPSQADLLSLHDPPLTAREEAIYLLHIVAEVEHAAMLQYLYAAFSLGGPQVCADKMPFVQHWRDELVSISREEMAHLVTVQNVLKLIGGPITFDRQAFPIPADPHPFVFKLEPLKADPLERYILAEMPDESELGPDKPIVEAIRKKHPEVTSRIGMIYSRILALLEQVPCTDFLADSVSFQIRADEWGLGYPDLLLLSVSDRDETRAAIQAIADQGESASLPLPNRFKEPSHFQRLLAIHQDEAFPKDDEWQPTRPLAVNPTVLQPPAAGASVITNPRSRLWAQLANLRYRLLLAFLSHAFNTPSTLNRTTRPTSRGLLVSLTFGEMYNLRSLGEILVSLPLDREGDPTRAGIPFDLPYTLALPERERDRWRLHRDILIASECLIDKILPAAANAAESTFLKSLKSVDQEAQSSIAPLVAG